MITGREAQDKSNRYKIVKYKDIEHKLNRLVRKEVFFKKKYVWLYDYQLKLFPKLRGYQVDWKDIDKNLTKIGYKTDYPVSSNIMKDSNIWALKIEWD